MVDFGNVMSLKGEGDTIVFGKYYIICPVSSLYIFCIFKTSVNYYGPIYKIFWIFEVFFLFYLFIPIIFLVDDWWREQGEQYKGGSHAGKELNIFFGHLTKLAEGFFYIKIQGYILCKILW